jgi:hypothetical protein
MALSALVGFPEIFIILKEYFFIILMDKLD